MIEALIRHFYTELWEAGNEAAAGDILHRDLSFRGSLGPEKTGIDGFLDYLRDVRTAVDGFRADILELVSEEDRAAARLRFHGTHRAALFGVEATGRRVEWAAAAFFAMRDGRLADIWVLGDVDGLRRQLAEAR